MSKVFVSLFILSLLAVSTSAAPTLATINGLVNIEEGQAGTWYFTTSAAPPNVLLTTTWTFGDGTHTAKINSTNVTHTYTVPGAYTIQIKVENTLKGAANATFWAEGTLRIRVVNRDPQITNIITSINNGKTLVPYTGQVEVGTNFFFQAEAFDVAGSNLHYSWLFGDCTKGVEGASQVYHQFRFPGVFTVTLQVSDEYGGYAISSTQVTIDCSPQLTNDSVSFLQNGNCHLYAKCTKINSGNFTCICETGFKGDGFSCSRSINPCLAGYDGYKDCVIAKNNLNCVPEILSAGLYTGEYQCSSCRAGFYAVGGGSSMECVKIKNPCSDYDSAASIKCRLANNGGGLTCVPQIITIGDGQHEALYTGNATCGDTCPVGFLPVSRNGVATQDLFCQVIPNPCLEGGVGAQNCTALGYLTCLPSVTSESIGSAYPLYTGTYACGNDGQCSPGYTLAPGGSSCVLIANPCRVGGPGYSKCAPQNRECLPGFTIDTFGNHLFLGDTKFYCGECEAGFTEDTIFDQTTQTSRQACKKKPNPCSPGNIGATTCGSDLCFPVVNPTDNTIYTSYLCLPSDTLHCPESYTTARYADTNQVYCSPTIAAATDNTPRTVGLAVGLALLALIIAIAVFVVLNKRKTKQAKLSYNFAQKQEFEIMTRGKKQEVINPLADAGASEEAGWDNPLTDNVRAPPTFDNPLNPNSSSSVASSKMQEAFGGHSTLSAATALSLANASRNSGPRIKKPQTGTLIRSDVDMNAFSASELMQLENPLYMNEEEGDFTNPLARSATVLAKKKKAGGVTPGDNPLANQQ